MDDLLRHVAQGVPLGCVYALVAIGLVLAFKTSGVFNLAFGAQAFLSLAVFYSLRVEEGWSVAPAFAVAVLIVAPLVGLVLDRCLFRFLRSASWLVRLVTALGLLAGLPEVIQLIFGSNPYVNPPGIAPNPDVTFDLGNHVFLSANELFAVGATVVVVVLLAALFRFTALGLQMRAVVESPRMLELAGVDSERVGMVAWMLSSLMAGVAGVLLGPLYGTVDANSFTTLLVVSITAAAFGRLQSLPITLVGAIALGIGQQTVAAELDPGSVLAQGLRPTLPFIVLFILLIVWVGNRREATDPLRGVDPPPPNLAVTYQDAHLRRLNRVMFPAFMVVLIASVIWWLPDLWVARVTSGLVLAVILLSITVITGLSGQVSAAQATLAGIGGFTSAQLADAWGTSVPVTMLAGAAVAGAIGALIAVVSMRLGGLYLTLLTLATALAADAVLFQLDWFTGGTSGLFVERSKFLGFDLSGDRPFFFFVLFVFTIVALVVILLRKGTTGRELAALRGSEVAAPSIGINPMHARIAVFAISAAIAGLGGGLYAMLSGGLYPGDPQFSALYGLVFVVLVVTLGARTVDGAVNAGLGFVLSQVLLDELGYGDNSLLITVAGFAIGAITYARHPEGIVEAQKLRNIRVHLHHRALTARAVVLENAGRLHRWAHPHAMTALVALPAFGYMAVEVGLGRELTETKVLVFGLLLVVPGLLTGFACHAWLARERACGLTGLLGVVYVTPVALFLLPHDFARDARRSYRVPGVDSTTGIGPAVGVGVNGLIQARRHSAQPPSTLAWAIVLGVGTLLAVGWVARMLWATFECQVIDAEADGPARRCRAEPGRQRAR